MARISDGIIKLSGDNSADIQKLASDVSNLKEELQYELSHIDETNMTSAYNKKVGSESGYTQIEQDEETLSLIAANEESIAEIDIEVDEISSRVENAEGDISELIQTSQGILSRVSTAEGNISLISQTADEISTRVSDVEGNVSELEQTATGLTSRITSAEGNINTLAQTATSLSSSIENVDGNVSTLQQTASSLTSRITSTEGNVSIIEQTSKDLTSEVYDSSGNSRITQNASSISAEVSNRERAVSGVLSTIDGLTVTFTDESGESTSFNINDDTIDITDFELNAGSIVAGTLSCNFLSGGTINGQAISGCTITGGLLNIGTAYTHIISETESETRYPFEVSDDGDLTVGNLNDARYLKYNSTSGLTVHGGAISGSSIHGSHIYNDNGLSHIDIENGIIKLSNGDATQQDNFLRITADGIDVAYGNGDEWGYLSAVRVLDQITGSFVTAFSESTTKNLTSRCVMFDSFIQGATCDWITGSNDSQGYIEIPKSGYYRISANAWASGTSGNTGTLFVKSYSSTSASTSGTILARCGMYFDGHNKSGSLSPVITKLYNIDDYSNQKTYQEGDQVMYNSILYEANVEIYPAEEWTSSHWNQVGETYSPSSTYSSGDIVVYNNSSYQAKVGISTPEAWTSSHWKQVVSEPYIFLGLAEATNVSTTNYTYITVEYLGGDNISM